MIRKPPAVRPREEFATIRAARTVADIAGRGTRVARRGGHFLRGVVCFFFAAIWGVAALGGGLMAGSLPTLIGVGGMAAFMAWAGRRAFAKARESA